MKKPRHGSNAVDMDPISNLQHPLDPDLEFPKPIHFEAGHYWQNNDPFYVVLLEDCQNAKKCEGCFMEFPKPQEVTINGKKKILRNISYNMCISHMEQYEYPKRDKDTRKILKWIPTKSMKRDRFYCVKKGCILSRHPYFWKGRLRIDEHVKRKLNSNHLKILREILSSSLNELFNTSVYIISFCL